MALVQNLKMYFKYFFILTSVLFLLSSSSCRKKQSPLTKTQESVQPAVMLSPVQKPGLEIPSFIKSSVIKIYVTIQSEDYLTPWQSGRIESGTGSGFVIKNKRILTNAHIVSNARYIQVQKDGDSTFYQARVSYYGHDCDLATVEVDDPNFFNDTTPVEFASVIPALNDEVHVFGYPLGGNRISITRGIVSRIDYGVYVHSAMDQHLVIQVDAAINPGNSGGPVLFGKKVVGLAFQGLSTADNIGYVIPLPVIEHFLTDIEDGKYDSYPALGVWAMELQNQAMRDDLNLPDDITGVAVNHIDPFGSAAGVLQLGDVLAKIDGKQIKYDGSIHIDDNDMFFEELLERKQSGQSVDFEVWRNNKLTNITVKLKDFNDPFLYRNIYNERPRYFIAGGLVFSPLNREIMKSVSRAQNNPNAYQLQYLFQYAKLDGLYKSADEFIILTRKLPHLVNTYADEYVLGVVEEINGIKIKNLNDIKKAFQAPKNGFHVLRFMNMADTLVLEASQIDKAADEIKSSYGIRKTEYLGDK